MGSKMILNGCAGCHTRTTCRRVCCGIVVLGDHSDAGFTRDDLPSHCLPRFIPGGHRGPGTLHADEHDVGEALAGQLGGHPQHLSPVPGRGQRRELGVQQVGERALRVARRLALVRGSKLKFPLSPT
jgi:hypothetical protein